ncbi:MAG TPA: hypothetical protein VNG53_00525 [Bacteroidia bacterium]|nr:hypothetical protein [Bacteroidia bacterium]
MKIKNLMAAGALLIAFAFVGTTVSAQTTEHQDKKALHHVQNKKAKNIAQRNRAEKNGHPKKAAQDEKKIHHDNRAIHKDRKAVKAAK